MPGSAAAMSTTNNPRWLDAEAAADYLSLRVDAFTRAVGAGRAPAPSRHLGPRTPRWDRQELDAMMSGGRVSTDVGSALDAMAEEAARGRKGR